MDDRTQYALGISRQLMDDTTTLDFDLTNSRKARDKLDTLKEELSEYGAIDPVVKGNTLYVYNIPSRFSHVITGIINTWLRDTQL